jgi:diadenosine tetraphosphate (Ap4A) HIT family hydrolase
MQQRNISDEEISDQTVYSTANWSVLLPKKPINTYHLMILANRHEAIQFTSLDDKELLELKLMVKLLIESFESAGVLLNGYNLFSNNGTYEIGQHLGRFHQHIFVRTQNEAESPYDIMATNRHWFEMGSSQWVDRLSELRSIFNS